MRFRPAGFAAICVLLAAPLRAQTPEARRVFTDVFPAAEFAARRDRVLDEIGDAVAVLQGAPDPASESAFRQNNRFFYLSGVEVPRAILVLDGRTRRSTLYLPERNRSRSYGPLLEPGPEAAAVTGLDAVLVRDSFASVLPRLAADGRTVYTPHRPEVFSSGSSGDARSYARAVREDPWDGRPSREEAFVAKLRAAAPGATIEDLDPVLDALRAIKSPREIEVIREATRITGMGIIEAMRDARPGMHEYELDAAAAFVFRKHGAQGDAYFPLVATGSNMPYSHYHRGTSVLRDGDLIQFDYAPDYHYYVSDVTRVFPANGRFTARQREFYTIYLRLYQSVLTSIAPHTTPAQIVKRAVVRMDSILAAYPFTDPAIEDAARRFVERYRASTPRSLGHTIGMEVHDVRLGSDVLLPGHVFTIEPAMNLADERLGMRLEDVVLITEDGYENLSALVPVEIEDIERLMAEPGVSDGLRTKPPLVRR